MPPDEPSPESEKKATEEPEAAEPKAAEPKAAEPKAAAPKAKPKAPPAGNDRTRTIVMMVLATLALTAVLTLVSESVFRGPKEAPSANANTTSATAIPTGDPPPSSGSRPNGPRPGAVPPIFVSVTFDHIEVDGIEVEKIAPLIKSGASGNLGKLASVMDIKRNGASVGGPVALGIEQGVPRNVIKSVMGTLALAGFRDVHLIGAVPDGGIDSGLIQFAPHD